MKTARVLFCSIIAVVLYCFIASSPASAQEGYATSPQQTPQAGSLVNFETNPDVPRDIHTLTQGVTLGLASSVSCLLFGIDPLTSDQRCLAPDPQTKKLGYIKNPGSALGLMNSMISMLYAPPIHSGEYVHYLSQNFGIVKPAYAAASKSIGGSGFDSIKPIIGLWITFRNITYMFFVIVFTIIGIAIMLRVKIDPRTVMSIENQIPKLILGIILVTLSFPIAGFLIDFMWVAIYLVIATIMPSIDTGSKIINVSGLNIFDNPAGVIGSIHIQTKVLGGEVGIPALLAIVGNGAGMVKDIIIAWVTQPAGQLPDGIKPVFDLLNVLSNLSFWPVRLACSLLGVGSSIKDVCEIAKAPLASLVGYVGGILAFFILGGMLLFALFRLWISLLKAYISILLAIVLAPFWIVAGALPGSPLGFGAWIKSLLSNLLAFPAAIVMLLLGFAFMTAFTTPAPNGAPQEMFTPPLLGITPDPGIIGTIIGIGTILLASQITNILKDAFKSPAFKYSAAIGQSFGATTGTIKGAGGTVAAGVMKTPMVGDRGGPGAVFKRILGA